MRIYPGLSAGYSILFLMYAEIIFLYYFNDLTGAVMTGLTFCVTTLIASIERRIFQKSGMAWDWLLEALQDGQWHIIGFDGWKKIWIHTFFVKEHF